VKEAKYYSNIPPEIPLPTFMTSIKAFFLSAPAPQPIPSELNKIKKYGELNSLSDRDRGSGGDKCEGQAA